MDLDRCTEKKKKKLGALYDIVIGHKIVYRKFPDNTQFVMFQIQNLNILMVCEEVNDGGYKLTNFYDAPVIFSVNDDKGNPHKTNQYLFICTDYCKKADNYSITKVVEGIKSVFDDDNNIYQASYIADDMIKMFDETGQQSYLDVAESIDELLLTRTDIIEEESIVIDKLQITYRQRKLSFSEKKILSEIATKSEDNLCKLSAFVLLGEKVEADSIISVISDNENEALLKAPIYNLYKKLEAT